MLSCEVISDLMVIYNSGEASAETRRLVEEHLAQCPACREAFGQGRVVEEALAEARPVEQPSNGQRFVARTRRLIFAVSVGAISLFACGLVALTRLVLESVAGIPIPHLPGSEPLWITVGAVALAVYLAALLWRRRWGRRVRPRAGRWFVQIPLALLAAIPLLVVALAAYHLMGTTQVTLTLLGTVLALSAALAITLVMLPRLTYATLATALAMMLVSAFLVGQTLVGVGTHSVAAIEWPADLGHPAEGVSPEQAVRVDLSPLDLAWANSEQVTWVDNVWIGLQAQATQATYEGDGLSAHLTAIEFEDSQGADTFFADWMRVMSEGTQIAHLEINLPGVPGQGRSLRTYSLSSRRAYYAWQTGRWVTIIKVPGSLAEARPLAQEIKELVVESYK